MTSFHSHMFTLKLQSVIEFDIKWNLNTRLKKLNDEGTWNRIRNHIFRRKESLCPQIACLWVWRGSAGGAVCSKKRHWHWQPSSRTPELPIYPLPLNIHTHQVQALYMSANTITHWHSCDLEVQRYTHSGVLACRFLERHLSVHTLDWTHI